MDTKMGSDISSLEMAIVILVGAILIYCIISVIFKIGAKQFKK
jgi:hypothetical protein